MRWVKQSQVEVAIELCQNLDTRWCPRMNITVPANEAVVYCEGNALDVLSACTLAYEWLDDYICLPFGILIESSIVKDA